MKMISFERYDHIKVEDALKYIDSIWEGSESKAKATIVDAKTLVDFLQQILTKDRYEDFDEDFKSLADWLHTPRHDKMKKARRELLEELESESGPVTEEDLAEVRKEWDLD